MDQIVASLPAESWNRLSAGDGSRGWLEYDCAWITLVAPETESAAGGNHWLLVTAAVPLRTLVWVAGIRWSIETCFQTGKGLGWMSTRFAAGTPGFATPRWSCSPTPS